LKLGNLNYRNILKKPIYIYIYNFFIKNKNILFVVKEDCITSEYIEEVDEKNDSVSLI
jgi:hypothetical protein